MQQNKPENTNHIWPLKKKSACSLHIFCWTISVTSCIKHKHMCPRDVYSKLRWIKLDVCLLCTGDIAIRHSTVCAVTLNEICVESIEERCLETRRIVWKVCRWGTSRRCGGHMVIRRVRTECWRFKGQASLTRTYKHTLMQKDNFLMINLLFYIFPLLHPLSQRYSRGQWLQCCQAALINNNKI